MLHFLAGLCGAVLAILLGLAFNEIFFKVGIQINHIVIGYLACLVSLVTVNLYEDVDQFPHTHGRGI